MVNLCQCGCGKEVIKENNTFIHGHNNYNHPNVGWKKGNKVWNKGKPRKLDVHHIDYNKKNNNPENLISLCQSCHQQTNWDREEWIDYYKNKVVMPHSS